MYVVQFVRQWPMIHQIPREQSLTAKSFSEKRRQAAVDRGLADNLAKARAVRAEKLEAAKAKQAKAVKAAKPARKVKAAQKTA